jgi:hypothetical protein
MSSLFKVLGPSDLSRVPDVFALFTTLDRLTNIPLCLGEAASAYRVRFMGRTACQESGNVRHLRS